MTMAYYVDESILAYTEQFKDPPLKITEHCLQPA